MFADPFVIYRDVASGAAASGSFTRISLNGNSSLYAKLAYDGITPKQFRTSHAVAGKGNGLRDRRLAQFIVPQTIDSVETGLNATFSIVADVPRVGIAAERTDSAFRYLIGLLRMASGDVAYGTVQANFWDKFMRGEA